MIKAIILDVDGVLIGTKEGVNFPYPHKDIIERLRHLRNEGLSINLCTGRGSFSIRKIVEDAGLNTFHVADGGGVVLNPISNEIGYAHNINKEVVKNIVQKVLAENIYLELYTVGDYYRFPDQTSSFTIIREKILSHVAKAIDDLDKFLDNEKIIRILPVAQSDEEIEKVKKIINSFSNETVLSLTKNFAAPELSFGVTTAPGISKRKGAEELSELTGIPLSETIGVGDTIHDWQFIEHCAYGATLESGTDEIKEKVKSKEDKGYISPKGVNENGLLDILDYFL